MAINTTTDIEKIHERMLTVEGGFTIEHALAEDKVITYALSKASTKYLLILFRNNNPIVPTIMDIDERFITSLLEREQREKRVLLVRWTVDTSKIFDASKGEQIDSMTWHPVEFKGRKFLEAYRSKESYELFLAASAAYNAREVDLWEPLLAGNCELKRDDTVFSNRKDVKLHLFLLGDIVQSLNFGYRMIAPHRCQPILYSPEKRFALLFATKSDGSAIQTIREVNNLESRSVIWENIIRTSHPLVPPVSLYVAKSKPILKDKDEVVGLDITLAFLDDDLRKKVQEHRFIVSDVLKNQTPNTRTKNGTWSSDVLNKAWIDDNGSLHFPNGESLSPFWIHANCPVIGTATEKTVRMY